jgi:hypothetical protein
MAADKSLPQFALRLPEPKTVSLPRELLRIEKFDMKKRILIMHFSNKNDPELPGSFSLLANKTQAVLSIGGKKIKSEFDWEI